MTTLKLISGVMLTVAAIAAASGPYSDGMADPTNAYDPGIAGFVGPSGDGTVSGNAINPWFIGWASGHSDVYLAGTTGDTNWELYPDPAAAYGPATGNVQDVITLGDLDASMLAAGDPVGYVTMTFDVAVRNGVGADVAIFENGFVAEAGGSMAELAYVEVSTDGVTFARFPSVSLTPGLVGGYGTVNPTEVYNLAGKHTNAYGVSWGTPFDLDDLAADPAVLSGAVDLMDINHVRVVDIPGDGSFTDSLGNPIYDAWVTWETGGFDLDAIGVLNEMTDYDDDGDVDGDDFDFLAGVALAGPVDRHYDLNHDDVMDGSDLTYMVENCMRWSRDGMSGWGTGLADFNLDGKVGLLDLAVLGDSYGQPAGWANGDANGDGVVGLLDLALLGDHYNFDAASIPEPASMLLLATGVAVVLKRRR
jgi:hypothetical protein